VVTAILLLTLAFPLTAKDKKDAGPAQSATNATSILWSEPKDIASRDLFYGPGGKVHEPHSIYSFEKEDLKGANPKFDVRDERGIKWKVKLGPEVKPEIAATGLLWAVRYFADEDYFLPVLCVKDM
jgi:hypothetical protein